MNDGKFLFYRHDDHQVVPKLKNNTPAHDISVREHSSCYNEKHEKIYETKVIWYVFEGKKTYAEAKTFCESSSIQNIKKSDPNNNSYENKTLLQLGSFRNLQEFEVFQEEMNNQTDLARLKLGTMWLTRSFQTQTKPNMTLQIWPGKSTKSSQHRVKLNPIFEKHLPVVNRTEAEDQISDKCMTSLGDLSNWTYTDCQEKHYFFCELRQLCHQMDCDGVIDENNSCLL